MIGGRSAVIAAGVVIGLASGCQTQAPNQSGGRAVVGTSALPPVSLPDISATAASVQKQIHDRYEALTSTLARPGAAPGEQAAAYGDLGRILMAARFNAEAAQCYAHAQALVPGDVRWPYLIGQGQLRVGDRAAAIAAFEHVLTREPDDVTALIWLAETQLDDGQVDRAQATFARAVATAPRSAAALFGAGRAALTRQSYPEAVRLMEQALAIEPAASAIHYPLAQAYRGLGDAAQADAHLRQRGNAYPTLNDDRLGQDSDVLESAVSLEGRGMNALKAGDFPAAESAFRRGLVLAPADASLRYWLGATLFASGRPADARREFERVLVLAPSFANAHFSLGAIAEAEGRRAEAIAHYKDAVQANPGVPEARVRLAEALRASGELAQSVPEYRAAVETDPRLVEAWLGGAKALIALGQHRDADLWLARAIRIHPERADLVALQSTRRPRP